MIPYLSDHNRKIKNANIFSLPAIQTCKPGTICRTFCYARKAERMYPQTLPCRQNNLRGSRLESFTSTMTCLIRESKHPVTRIHEAGDFYSEKYVSKWFRIATNLPEHRFFAFTKRDDILVKHVLEGKPPNLKLIYSLDGIRKDDADIHLEVEKYLEKGFDKVAVIRETRHTCPSNAKDGWKRACIKDCRKCLDDKTFLIEFGRH